MSWQKLTHAADPALMAGNPHKGFVRFATPLNAEDEFPHSIEYLNFPVADVMTAPDTFDWSKLDARLDEIAQRQHWVLLRPWVDTPGLPTGVPKFLLDQGVATHAYDDHDNDHISVSPDYADSRLVDALVAFIQALGAHLEGDPRMDVVQAGLLGFWGEWHTYPHDEWFAPEATQKAVLDAYAKAFPTTPRQVRLPYANSVALGFGYHDDSFAATTLPPIEWHFLPKLTAAGADGAWKLHPIGGEIYPPFQQTLFDDPPGPAEVEPFAACVTATHVTSLLNQSVFDQAFAGPRRDRALAAAASLGYQLTVVEAHLPDAPTTSAVTIDVHVTNEGVAPFHADWAVRLESAGASVPVDAKLPAVLPGETATWSATLPQGWSGGSLLLCVDPAPAGHPPLHFANAEDSTVKPGCVTLRP